MAQRKNEKGAIDMTNGIRGIFNGDFGGVGGFGFLPRKGEEKTEEVVQASAPEVTPLNPDEVMNILDKSVNAFVPQQPALQVNLSEDVIARVQKSMEEYVLTRGIVEDEFGSEVGELVMDFLADTK